MADLFVLSPDIKAIATSAIDSLIHQLGKPCKLVFPTKKTACSNCLLSAGNKSANIYRSGGQVPFPNNSVCPLCNGAGYEDKELTQTITMLVAWSPAEFWVKAPLDQQIPDGSIQTKGFLSDLPAILKSRQMILEPAVEGINRYRFFLQGEPIEPGNIIQARYCVQNWVRRA